MARPDEGVTTEADCLEALREAADRLGDSPTKAQYEELGLTPASATIMNVLGGWNAAKEKAELETYDRGATGEQPVQPKPERIEIPDDVEWEELTGQQRWYYKNREDRIARKDRRREELRRWLLTYKDQHCECVRCGENQGMAAYFHHPGEKEFGIARMVVNGHSKQNIRTEIDRCIVLCANCHRLEHADLPEYDSVELQPDNNK